MPIGIDGGADQLSRAKVRPRSQINGVSCPFLSWRDTPLQVQFPSVAEGKMNRSGVKRNGGCLVIENSNRGECRSKSCSLRGQSNILVAIGNPIVNDREIKES